MAGFLGNQPPKVPLTSSDIADGTITNDDLAGSIADAKISALSASKLTGSIADARVPASAVTQHVTGYDDASIRSDILKLALHQAVEGNRVAYNLENSFIDGFEDDTGITTETNVDRDVTSEYVNTVSYGTPDWVSGDRSSTITVTTTISEASGDVQNLVDGVHDNSGNHSASESFYWANGSNNVADAEVRFVFSTAQLITGARIQGSNYNASQGTWKWQVSGDGTSWTDIGSSFTWNVATGLTWYDSYGASLSGNTLPYRYYRLLGVSGSTSGSDWYGEVEFKQAPITINATGTLISDPQTASSSRTSCSGVIVYEDSSGTATLGTDLEVYFTANNGTNWTEAASYGTATTYSGTKKLVKLGATTVTAGTQVAMKSVWANQLASSGTTKTITASGDAQHSTSENKIGATSLKCDGTGDFLGIDSHADFNFGTSLWTVEFWYKSTVSTLQSLVCIGDWSSSAGPIVIYQSSDGDLGYHTKLSTGVISNETAGAVAIDTGSWVHIAVSRTTSTTIKAFINGTEEAALAETISSGATMEPLGTHGNNSSGKVFHIGRMYEAGSAKTSYDLNGYIDEVRISKTARYTSNFTPSTSAFTTDSNTVLLIHSDTSNASTTFTDSSALTGKEARLHGWAVNY